MKSIAQVLCIISLLLSFNAYASAPSVVTDKTKYQPYESVSVKFSGFPGNQYDWITIAEKGSPDSFAAEVHYTGKKKSGIFNFSGFSPGEYEVRGYADWPRGGYKVIVRKGFTIMPEATGASRPPMRLLLNKSRYSPDEEILVTFTTSPSFRQDAWIGIIPSSLPHINESENDKNDISYQYIGSRKEGVLVFRAPPKTGEYDLRMHDTDAGGEEVAFVSFLVANKDEPLIAPQPIVKTNKAIYNPNEAIVVEYAGFSGSSNDYITIVLASEPDVSYGEYFYTKGNASGKMTFSGFKSGKYEVRGYFFQLSGGHTIKVRYPFLVD